MSKSSVKSKKVVLAYSGGLDTSIILKWLQVEFSCEVVTFTADLGQGEELEPARKKALAAGVSAAEIEQVALLALTTRGFPAVMAAWGWMREVLEAGDE